MEAFKKIKIVSGDVIELGLGLTDEDRATLIKDTNIIFHAAASVRFDDPLKKAILLNTRGTREVAHLALQMNNLLTLMYVSTTYSQCHLKRVEERTYPPLVDWQRTIDLAEHVDEHLFDIMTLKYIHPMPNTYTFSKNLAEACINDLCQGKIPTIIFRPSIVISSAIEPMPGWIDNFNGPIGLMIASGKGVLRTFYTNPDIIPDYIPVDLIVKSMISVTWDKIVNCNHNNYCGEKLTDVTVYNGSNNRVEPVTMGEMIEIGKTLTGRVPLPKMLWYPGGDVTYCWYYHFFRVLFYQLLPAFFIDGLLKLSGHKFRLTKIHQKIYGANMALQYFITKEWDFPNNKVLEMQTKLLQSDFEDFSYHDDEIDPYSYFEQAALGCKMYLLKEDVSNFEADRRSTFRMWTLSITFNFVWYATLLWLVFIKYDIISVLQCKCNELQIYFTTV